MRYLARCVFPADRVRKIIIPAALAPDFSGVPAGGGMP